MTISLPDIDVDVPAEHRDEVIDYIKKSMAGKRFSDDYVWQATGKICAKGFKN